MHHKDTKDTKFIFYKILMDALCSLCLCGDFLKKGVKNAFYTEGSFLSEK
jgi:hypothetical protein